MIEFACKQCGRLHQRPGSAVGTLVFCECGHGNRVPWADAVPAREIPAEVLPAGPDPAFCLNHPEVPSERRCADCGEAFCAGCMVILQGQTRCGPCKNHRIRILQRPPRIAALAVVAPVVALLGGPLALCLTVAPLNAETSPALCLGLGAAGLVLPLAGLLLGCLALREIENDPRLGGRALAMTGTVTALVSVVWCLTVGLLITFRQWVI